MKLKMPKRFINRLFVYAGLFGIVFQLVAFIFAWYKGISLQASWALTLAGPLLCILSGMTPALQLQKESEAKRAN